MSDGGAVNTYPVALADPAVIASARLPVVYEAACVALQHCADVDECKEWADKMSALQSYARQTGDETLLNFAKRIKGRAVRQMGQLLNELQRADLELRRADQIRKKHWIAQARLEFFPSPRSVCAVCGQFASLTHAHHLAPLAWQWDDGIRFANHAHAWLCPTHHAAIHVLLGAGMAVRRGADGASNAAIAVIGDMSQNTDEFRRLLRLAPGWNRERDEAPVNVPVDQLTEEECDQKYTELIAMGNGCFEHADEFKRYHSGRKFDSSTSSEAA